jgi:hypothetical protein
LYRLQGTAFSFRAELSVQEEILAQADHGLFPVESSVLKGALPVGKDLMDVEADGIGAEIDDRDTHKAASGDPGFSISVRD